MKIGQLTFQIAPQFVDFRARVKLSSLVDMILTASGYNADENGFGLRHLNTMGATWVISRFAMEINQFPKEYDKITIETWVEEIHTYNTIRNYRIYNDAGQIIANSTSVWVMINLQTRRPMELTLLEGIDAFALHKTSGIDRPLKLDEVPGEPTDLFRVKYSDIDINQHVNTVHYLDWMVNSFTLDEHQAKTIRRLDLNFMNEVLWGNQVAVFKETVAPDDFRFEIKADNKTAFRGRVVWN